MGKSYWLFERTKLDIENNENTTILFKIRIRIRY